MIKTILLLDDDPDERFILEDAFDLLRVDVIFKQVQTFTALLEELEKAIVLPDILLLDINLPEVTGMEVITQLKAHRKYGALPIVMYTNAGDDQTIKECFNAGASGFMKKTTTLKQLKQFLDILLAWNTQTLFQLPVTQRTFLN